MGAYLRATRRKRRISIERAAEETRIRADFLMRMESDEFDFLAPAYVRGFLRNYARYLEVDPDPLITEFERRFGAARTDTDQIVALERRSRRAPRDRKRFSSWTVAASIAAVLFTALAAVGLFSSPEPSRTADGVTFADESASPEPDDSPSPDATASPDGQFEDETLALSDGLTVEIIAKRGDCWLDVTADGSNVFTSDGDGLALGERAGPFTAEETMDIVLGNAGAVDIIVNGRRFTSLGGDGDVVTIKLPRDVEALL